MKASTEPFTRTGQTVHYFLKIRKCLKISNNKHTCLSQSMFVVRNLSCKHKNMFFVCMLVCFFAYWRTWQNDLWWWSVKAPLFTTLSFRTFNPNLPTQFWDVQCQSGSAVVESTLPESESESLTSESESQPSSPSQLNLMSESESKSKNPSLSPRP